MTPECLITGCRLYIPDEGKSLWGDLWLLGGCPGPETYIFNGVLNSNGEASWDYDRAEPVPIHTSPTPSLSVLSSQAYFERRGVVVVSDLDVELSQTAALKLQRYWLRQSPRVGVASSRSQNSHFL